MDSSPPPSLGDWLTSLVANLAADPVAIARLQALVGARRARIRLDDEVATISLRNGHLVFHDDEATPVQGSGSTTRAAVLALLDGHLDMTDATAGGYITAVGNLDTLVRIHAAVEVLVDAASRMHALRALASAYRAAGPPVRLPPLPDPAGAQHREQMVLERLGLLGP